MSRFFFNVRDAEQVMLDPERSVLPDIATAMSEAVASARWFIGSELQHRRLPTERWFEIVNEAGQLVATFAFKDTLHDATVGGEHG